MTVDKKKAIEAIAKGFTKEPSVAKILSKMYEEDIEECFESNMTRASYQLRHGEDWWWKLQEVKESMLEKMGVCCDDCAEGVHEGTELKEKGPCWDGFKQVGMKNKGGKQVPNCVPESWTQEEFDEATLRLHIPFGFYEDQIHGRKGSNALARAEEVRRIITKPGIDVIITHDLLDTQQIINLLAQNTINCYFYDYLDGCGLASSPDYALAAGRPIAVTRSHQMRNYWDLKPSVLIENSSIREIIANGTAPLEPLYKAYSKESVWQDYSRILNRLLNN